MIIEARSKTHRMRNAGVVVGVAAAHLIVFALIARSQPLTPASLPPTPIDIILMRPPAPPPPPPPPPPAKTSPVTGGGAPAAPSRVHRSPLPVPQPELPAPPKPSPTVSLNVGVSDIASPTPGMGQGGQGTGTGSGTGAGDGPGRGVRTPPRNLRRPSPQEVLRYVPREALARRISGTVLVRCLILRDQRLDQCRVVSEMPTGYGFGEAATRVAEDQYRFSPGLIDGVYEEGLTVTVTVNFGRPATQG
ncbi:MAG: TonB family protein [Brevundimonas sp.]|nr:MAG: TonB family protein [Brevundimonas sp.]